MSTNIARELAALQRLSMPQLRARYAEVFGETTNANNRTWLLKKIAWRLQAQAEGGLSERARQRAAELANDADLRANPPLIAYSVPYLALLCFLVVMSARERTGGLDGVREGKKAG